MESGALFLNYSIRKLEQLSGWAQDSLDALTEEQIWARLGDKSNSPGNLALHLCGNVRQWIIAALGDQPDHRDRAAEFSAGGGLTREQLKDRLRGTVHEAGAILRDLPASRLGEPRLIQGYQVSTLEAVYQVVQHFALHTGQIVLLAKAASGRDFGFYSYLTPTGSAKAAPESVRGIVDRGLTP